MTSTREGPRGEIVHQHIENGSVYQVEKLDPPIVRGAGARHYRLWCNDVPTSGAQYHYDMDSVMTTIEWLTKCTYIGQIKVLRERVARLERSHRLTNALLGNETEAGTPLNQQDIMFEIRELERLILSADTPVPYVEDQEKRIRMMLQKLFTRGPQ